jgi:predicted esterase YcpF (UPF0227 family)
MYIHGWAHGYTPSNSKPDAIKEYFGSRANVYCPTVSHFGTKTIDELYDFLGYYPAGYPDKPAPHPSRGYQTFNINCDIFVGTSMGGFWADFLARTVGGKALLINPVTQPTVSLLKYVGDTDAEGNCFTKEILEEYIGLQNRAMERRLTYPSKVLLAEDDNIINHLDALTKYSKECPIETFKDGGHRFNKYDEINKSIEELLCTEVM